MSEFTLFLLKISKEIENKDLNTMKICCSHYDIGAQRLEKITEAYELFKELERRDLLGPENTDVLVNLLEQAGRIDLRNRVLERSRRGESQSSVPDGPVRNNILKDARLNDISEDLSRDWKQLGRKLGISNNIIDNIDDENRRVKDKSVQMLLKWKRQSGNDATGEVLANALIAIGRRDVAETLANKSEEAAEDGGRQLEEGQAPGKSGDSIIAPKVHNNVLYNDAYLRALESGKAKNRRIPIMIVGKDRVGKTSLKKHLLGQLFDYQEPSTKGIDVAVVELTEENAEDPWGMDKKEAKFFTTADEAKDKLLKHTVKLVTDREQDETGISSSNSETLSKEILTPKEINRIEKLRGENSASENMIDEKSITIFVHDFAGQSIFYDTHFCFLKMQCPYLLVVDLSLPLDGLAKPRYELPDFQCDVRDPFLATNLDHTMSWLTVLARLSKIYSESALDNHPEFKLPPVVIALTNSDRCKSEEDITKVKKRIQDILLEKAFTNVFQDIYVIDNTLPDRNGEEIRKLRLKLYKLCKSILEHQEPMPFRWLQLEVALSKKIVDKGLMHIPVEECRTVARSCNVVDVEAAITFLHRQGIIVYHSKSPVVVLDPPWLINLFMKVITIPNVKDRRPKNADFYKLLSEKGILMQENLRKIVDGELLEDLMKQFSLICPWTHDEKPAYIVPSMAPLMKKGGDVEKKLSSSVVAPVFVDFGDWRYVPIGFYTRLQTTMINRCREVLENKRPKLFCSYTRLTFTYNGFSFGVYLIKILAKIKVGVIPLDSSSERDHKEFVSYLKKALKDCMQKVKNDEPLIYCNVNPSLLVKCCRKKDVCCPLHGDGCDRDECANFWSLEELQDLNKDPFCPHDSVDSERFALNSVRHWLYTNTETDTEKSEEEAQDRGRKLEQGQASGKSGDSIIAPRACRCTDIFTRSLALPDSKFELEPRVFPLVSGNVIVGTAFIFKDRNSKSHVISWSSKPQPTCITIVKRDDRKEVRTIPLRKVGNRDLLTENVPEDMCSSVPEFKAAGSNTEVEKLFMASPHCVCGCQGLLMSRLSKICPLKKLSDATYVRRRRRVFKSFPLGRVFKSFPLGAPVVDCEDKLVGIVTGSEKDKVTVLGIQDLIRLL